MILARGPRTSRRQVGHRHDLDHHRSKQAAWNAWGLRLTTGWRSSPVLSQGPASEACRRSCRRCRACKVGGELTPLSEARGMLGLPVLLLLLAEQWSPPTPAPQSALSGCAAVQDAMLAATGSPPHGRSTHCSCSKSSHMQMAHSSSSLTANCPGTVEFRALAAGQASLGRAPASELLPAAAQRARSSRPVRLQAFRTAALSTVDRLG